MEELEGKQMGSNGVGDRKGRRRGHTMTVLAFQCDVLAGLDCSSTWAFDCLGWNKTFVVLSGVCVSSLALDEPAEHLPVCCEESFCGFECWGNGVCWLEPCSWQVQCV